MYICICNAISDKDIVNFLNNIDYHSKTNEEIINEIKCFLDFDFNCGTCLSDFENLINSLKKDNK